MKLSVCIVNYNVCDTLAECLESVEAAMAACEAEVFVVDNNSTDGSCQMIERDFPWVVLLKNSENKGFAKANNQAIRMATGEYVLLLNPDTVVRPDLFAKALPFMDEHPDCGGLGVKMLDANGRFLPESKRGIPTPFVAFCKLFGLAALFPKSDTFNHYYLGTIPEDATAEIEILAGACMFLRKATLDAVGLLDEKYFLYGEDVDLSYRILLKGFKNYYLPTTGIVHKKGESTKKESAKSRRAFFESMEIFVDRHFAREYPALVLWFIKKGIRLRAAIDKVCR